MMPILKQYPASFDALSQGGRACVRTSGCRQASKNNAFPGKTAVSLSVPLCMPEEIYSNVMDADSCLVRGTK